MNLKIKNFGKIADADIKFDGITVICGDNNTGKSTVGKALFSFFNSLYDYRAKIFSQKSDAVRDFVFKNINSIEDVVNIPNGILSDSLKSYISEHSGKYTFEEVKKIFEVDYPIKVTKEKIMPLVDSLNSSDKDILNLSVFRYLSNVMNGQIKNISNGGRCYIKSIFRDSQSSISVFKSKCVCEIDEPIMHCAYYINNPFVIDFLNNHAPIMKSTNIMEWFTIQSIINAQRAINENSMANILDSVANANDIEKINEIIKKAYSGNTILSNGKYFYTENGVDFDIRNISAGLKSFAIIERLLETGVLKKKDVLILDEPEIHLHSEWQIIYAELIVILQKTFDLTILLVTHSSQFLESLIYYMEKYAIADKGNYYIPVQNEKGVTIVDRTDNLIRMKKSLKSGLYTLANKKLEELTSGDSDEEDNE